MATPKTFIYKHTGEEAQEIKGIGLVQPGEEIAIPFQENKHKDLEPVRVVEAKEDESDG